MSGTANPTAAALVKLYAQYQREERGRNAAEVVYWRQQYKQLAADAIAALTAPPSMGEPVVRIPEPILAKLSWAAHVFGTIAPPNHERFAYSRALEDLRSARYALNEWRAPAPAPAQPQAGGEAP